MLVAGHSYGLGCDGVAFVSVTASSPTLAESGGTTATFNFSAGFIPLASDTHLTLQISGLAANGIDYQTLPTQVTIPALQTQTLLTLTPIPDAVAEGGESVMVTILATDNLCVLVGSPSTAMITIFDGAVAPPIASGAVSRKLHGAAGEFDLPLSPLTTNPTTEPRQGPTQTIVFKFDKPIDGVTIAVSEGTATPDIPDMSGNDLIVNLTGVIDQQYVTITLTNVSSPDGGTGGNASVRFGVLAGDVNGNRVVTLADVGQVNAQLAQQVTAANFLMDVNVSGTLSLADKGLANAKLTNALLPP